MKLRRRSKVSLWFAESRAAVLKRTIFEREEGMAWLKKWREKVAREENIVRTMQDDELKNALKEMYPDNVPPAPLGVMR